MFTHLQTEQGRQTEQDLTVCRKAGAGREQPDRISQTEEKLIELVLIEKSTDPSPAVRVQLWWCMLKGWRRNRVGWGEFRCQRECGMNLYV